MESNFQYLRTRKLKSNLGSPLGKREPNVALALLNVSNMDGKSRAEREDYRENGIM